MGSGLGMLFALVFSVCTSISRTALKTTMELVTSRTGFQVIMIFGASYYFAIPGGVSHALKIVGPDQGIPAAVV